MIIDKTTSESLLKYIRLRQSLSRTRALDYFGFEGKYDPGNNLFTKAPGEGVTDPHSGDIYYNDGAFEKGYGNLHFDACHELIHRRHVLTGIYDNKIIDSQMSGREEWTTYSENYRNQGLYSKYHVDIVSKINEYGAKADIYHIYITPKGNHRTEFVPQWWHIVYKIPRKY